MEVRGKTLSDVTEVIDGNHYTDCRFEKCLMIYRGGDIPHINGCQFETCTWKFEGAAERTLTFMRQVYHGMGAGGRQLIEATMQQVRKPADPENQPGSASAPPPPK
jgi:hypothetical protein